MEAKKMLWSERDDVMVWRLADVLMPRALIPGEQAKHYEELRAWLLSLPEREAVP